MCFIIALFKFQWRFVELSASRQSLLFLSLQGRDIAGFTQTEQTLKIRAVARTGAEGTRAEKKVLRLIWHLPAAQERLQVAQVRGCHGGGNAL